MPVESMSDEENSQMDIPMTTAIVKKVMHPKILREEREKKGEVDRCGNYPKRRAQA